MFKSGDAHPRSIPLTDVASRIRSLKLRGLTPVADTLRRDGRYRKIDMLCCACGTSRTYHVDNLLSGKTKGCRCQQRAGKYRDPRSITLGGRYDAIVQRCERPTHVSYANYGGRGIRCFLGSREKFIRWALKKYQGTDFVGYDFDRIDTNGHYEYSNLQLVTRSINLRNRRGSKNPPAPEEASDLLLTIRKRSRPTIT